MSVLQTFPSANFGRKGWVVRLHGYHMTERSWVRNCRDFFAIYDGMFANMPKCQHVSVFSRSIPVLGRLTHYLTTNSSTQFSSISFETAWKNQVQTPCIHRGTIGSLLSGSSKTQQLLTCPTGFSNYLVKLLARQGCSWATSAAKITGVAHRCKI